MRNYKQVNCLKKSIKDNSKSQKAAVTMQRMKLNHEGEAEQKPVVCQMR